MNEWKDAPFNKIPARPRGGRPLTDRALLSPFFGCAERYDGAEIVPLLLGFCIGTVWVSAGNSTAPVPVIPCRKGVEWRQKILEEKSK